ncbi:serine hydrolase domain-containing protein [Bremerella alba]|uniref:Protein flp n=1 Tax=Bremerella alba TaxID=980252 RepID=A0A7V9A641_9BACT|nr:serine hydrolase domain-containing protein [Bremerella alba]MBA2113556.1 Protein flp [Bremerella alba]
MILRCTHLLIATILSFAISLPLLSEMPKWQQASERLDSLTPKLLQQHQVPGASIALIEHGEIIWAKAYGVTNALTQEPVTVETVFEACSMSKPVFTYAVLKLVEQGKLELDRPLVDYMEKPYLSDEPLHRIITARMVFSHTSGFPNWRRGKKLSVAFEPGTSYRYSGEGFLFLQKAVERIVDEPLEPWIQQSLLQPLMMADSSFIWQTQYKEKAAAGHDSDGKVKGKRRHYEKPNSAYTLYTTPSDYARFLVEMLRSDRAARHSLKSGTIENMLTPQITLPDNEDRARGLGWVLKTGVTPVVAYHSGSNGTGFRCNSQFDPKTNVGVVIMTNGVNGRKVWQAVMEVLEEDLFVRP